MASQRTNITSGLLMTASHYRNSISVLKPQMYHVTVFERTLACLGFKKDNCYILSILRTSKLSSCQQ